MKRTLISTSAITSAIAASLALAACGGPGEGTYEDEEGNQVDYDVDADGGDSEFRIRGDDGEEMVINSGSNVAADLPDGYTIYPGATVVSATNMTQADGSGSMVILTTDDSAQEVASFYRRQAEAAGIEIQMEMNSNGSVLMGGEGSGGETFSINASPSDGGTMAQLVVGKSNN